MNTFLFFGLLIIASIHANFYSEEFGVHCIESEQQAPLKFKQHLNDPLNQLASWAGDEDCCCWKIWFCISYKTHSASNKHGSISFMIDNMHYVTFII